MLQPLPARPPRCTRRRALASLALVTLSPPLARPADSSARPAASGPRLPSFDEEMEQFMRERDIPGGALAVVKDRRLVYARGYGRVDRDRPEPVKPESLFRIASVSKPFTAVAILKLVEQGRLQLDDRAFDRLAVRPLITDAPDARWRRITVRQLLQHTAGWDREKSSDPMFRARQIATDLGLKPPPVPREIIRHQFGRPLDFDPGTRYAYSNFGYCSLGRLIEEITGESYETFTRRTVLAPAGIRRMRVGKTLPADRADGEVRYHPSERALTENVFAPDGPRVPWPDGGFALESMDAHGGWIASVVDLARFAAALDPEGSRPLLPRDIFNTLHAPPPPPVSRNDDGTLKPAFYACGWMVRPVGKDGRFNAWHAGSLPGGHSLLVRRWGGLSWAVLFNQRSSDFQTRDAAIDPALHRAAAAVREWPAEDLFPSFA